MDDRRPDTYFAELDGEELVQALRSRFDAHIERLKKSGRHDRMRRSWLHYYARSANGGWEDTTRIASAGRQGETSIIRPNRYRARMQRILNMNAGSKPAWDCVALNSDAKTSRQAQLGDHIIEHYGSREKLYERLLERDEMALVFGESFIVAIWDPNRGEVYAYKDELVLDADGEPVMDETERTEEVEQLGEDGTVQLVAQTRTVATPRTEPKPVYKGDFRFLVLSPYDCAIEPYSEDRDQPAWAIFRYQVNRYDAAEVYPQAREAILRANGCSASRKELDFLNEQLPDEDAIWLYEFHNVRSPGCPRGRTVRFIEGHPEPLLAGPLRYQGLPVFRTAPGDVLLQDGGYTPGFDLLPVVEARQAQTSTILTNLTGSGAQLFEMQKNAAIEPMSLGPLTIFQTSTGQSLRAINLAQVSPQSLTFLDVLEREEDFVTGLNAAARGDAHAMKGDSGAKGALILSAAQQMQTRFQLSRQLADSKLLTHVIDTLKKEATVERVIEIAGLANTYAAQTFVGEDLEGISRVLVRPSNPLKDTQEGRAQLFEAYMKLGAVRTPEDVYQVMTTGTLAQVDEEWTAELTLVKQENELLSDETSEDPVPVMPTDAHAIHLRKHRCVFANPRLRTNAKLLQRYQTHIMEHIQALMQMPPQILQMLGEQPIAPQPMPQGGAPEMPKESGDDMPDMPKPPINPATGERANIAQPPALQAQTI